MLSRIPPKISLAHLPTPLRKLSRLSSRFASTNIWLKHDDMSGFSLSGNKVRKLEYLLADAIAAKANTIITCGGIQSNHCRATAFACAQLGLKCHLILRDDFTDIGSTEGRANHFLSSLAGASIELHSPKIYTKTLNSLFAKASQKVISGGGLPYSIPTGGSNGLGVWAYTLAVQELKSQCERLDFMPDAIVCASGSGGTQAGVILGVDLFEVPADVIGFAVCDSQAYFNKKIKSDLLDCFNLSGFSVSESVKQVSLLNVVSNDNYIGPGYARAYPELYACIDDLAKMEGVLLDPVYTGKAFYGLLCELANGRLADYKNIVFLHTGGAFGLFPHAAAFMAKI